MNADRAPGAHINQQQLRALIGDNPSLLGRLAKAYLGQVPGWMADFEHALQAGDSAGLARLLHKMKGSCHAISASNVALEFEQAEQRLEEASERLHAGQSSKLEWSGNHLLHRVREIEEELQLIIESQSSPK
jgi:HPt (histidine-containing phosphotransfer) domain-containing protein